MRVRGIFLRLGEAGVSLQHCKNGEVFYGIGKREGRARYDGDDDDLVWR